MPVATSKTKLNIPEGVREAVLVHVVDIGTQFSEMFQSKSKKVILSFEISGLTNSDGAPVLVSKFYTLSISPKSALRRDLEGLLGRSLIEKKLELKTLLGTPVLIQLTKSESNGKERTNITNVMQIPGKKKLPHVSDLISFDITDHVIPESIPEWIREYILKSEEYGQGGFEGDYPENDEAPGEESGLQPF
jgi:hypothetical protein